MLFFTLPSPAKPMYILYRSLWLCGALLLAQTASARCNNTGNTRAYDTESAPIPFGRVNLTNPTDPVLQPVGTLLASIIVPATNYTAYGATGETGVWRCDKKDVDKGEVFFLVSTNGDSRYGGEHDIGRADGLVDVHATWFKGVGLRLSMEGVNLTRYWKKVPLKNYIVINENGKARVEIRLQDIPPLQAELYRVSQDVPGKGNVYGCGSIPRTPDAAGTLYTCNQPAGYIQLHGPGINHDDEWSDHNKSWKFWASNGIGYTLYKSLTLSNTPTCVVRSATPHMHFATIGVQQLDDEGAASARHRCPRVQTGCNRPRY